MTILRRYWPLLFPLTYLAHIAEEYYGGFPEWASHHLGFDLTTAEFLELNTIAWTIMFLSTVLVIRFSWLAWLTVSFATATLINGCAHAIGSAITLTYSPGVISGVSLWIPLGIVTLYKNRPHISRKVFWASVGVGIALHLAVTVLARAAPV
jgi:uncharacterized protein with HXXEE motif